MKSLAVIGFIVAIAGIAMFCAQQRTVARGEVLAAGLVQSNSNVKAMRCDEKVPIGLDGATFTCKVEYKNGLEEHYKFKMNRDSSITALDRGPGAEPPIKKTSDPWAE